MCLMLHPTPKLCVLYQGQAQGSKNITGANNKTSECGVTLLF